MKQVLNVLILPIVLVVVVSGCSDNRYPSINTLYKDYLARLDIKKEKYEEALSKYYSLLEDDGERAATHSNIGIILNSIQKSEDALKSLQHALRLAESQGDKEMIFKVRYNLGSYYGALKKIPEALDHYQAALDIVPDSLETKTNIELLIQQQQQKEQSGDGEQNQDKSKSGQDQNKKDKQGNDKKDQKDQKDEKEEKDQKDENKDQKDEQKKQSSPKYQPRPFKGDQLSEGDVKKILGELKNQEQKIRANFEKKEKGKSNKNEKDW